jgi:serine-type D-Ala-D-Ala carboxypeptidase/endopeptidase
MRTRQRALLSLVGTLLLAVNSCTASGAVVNTSLPTTEVPATQPPVTAASTAPASSTPAAPTLDIQAVGAALGSTVPPALQPNGASACSVAVVFPQPGANQLQTAFFNYGTLAKDSGTPANSTTEYEIGSLTKLFTADMLALFVEDGSMKLEDPLQQYLPPAAHVPTYDGNFITLRQLSTHTSGLPRTLPKDGLRKANGVSVYGLATGDEVFSFLDTYKLTRAPGAKWEYSNLANGILGIAEERVGDATYEQLVASKITTPLGMADTHITLTAEENTRLAASYTDKGKPVAHMAETGALLAAGAFRSTTRDMALYLAANMQPDGTPLGTAIRMTLQKQDREGAPGDAMGLGWLITDFGTSQQEFNKTGATLGYNSYIAFWPGTQTGYVLLCNGRPVSDLGPALNKLIGGGQALFGDSE